MITATDDGAKKYNARLNADYDLTKWLTFNINMSYSCLLYTSLEYYSQFPAHNTVCVDGISSYPVMKSNHAFKLLNLSLIHILKWKMDI